jgi:hypothetical protein
MSHKSTRYEKKRKMSKLLALRTFVRYTKEVEAHTGIDDRVMNEYYVAVCAARWYTKRKRKSFTRIAGDRAQR